MQDRDVHLWTFGSAFLLSSFAGLASLLRSGKRLTWKSVATAALNAGLMGLGVAMLWAGEFGLDSNSIWFVIGVCVMAGLGGSTMIDFVTTAIQHGGITINISHKAPRASEESSEESGILRKK